MTETEMVLHELFETHLNVSWLRPDNVSWETTASYLVKKQGISRPALDMGCGNGIFSFITAGGEFGVDFDWYIQVQVDEQARTDIYDAAPTDLAHSVARMPDYRIDVGLDFKQNLLDQSALLGFYERCVPHNANDPLPFEDGEFATIFSNILYWLDEPVKVLREIRRVLSDDGRAILCVPDPTFYTLCESYRWRELDSDWLRLLNGGRDQCIRWTATESEFRGMSSEAGLSVDYHQRYLRRRTLQLWDLGLRSVSRPLIKMVNNLNRDQRAEFKREWMNAARPLVKALQKEEMGPGNDGGFHFFVLRKAP